MLRMLAASSFHHSFSFIPRIPSAPTHHTKHMALLPPSGILSPRGPPAAEEELTTPTLGRRVAAVAAEAAGQVKKHFQKKGGDGDPAPSSAPPPPAMAGKGNCAVGDGVETTTLPDLAADPEGGWPAGAVPESPPATLSRL